MWIFYTFVCDLKQFCHTNVAILKRFSWEDFEWKKRLEYHFKQKSDKFVLIKLLQKMIFEPNTFSQNCDVCITSLTGDKC